MAIGTFGTDVGVEAVQLRAAEVEVGIWIDAGAITKHFVASTGRNAFAGTTCGANQTDVAIVVGGRTINFRAAVGIVAQRIDAIAIAQYQALIALGLARSEAAKLIHWAHDARVGHAVATCTTMVGVTLRIDTLRATHDAWEQTGRRCIGCIGTGIDTGIGASRGVGVCTSIGAGIGTGVGAGVGAGAGARIGIVGGCTVATVAGIAGIVVATGIGRRSGQCIRAVGVVRVCPVVGTTGTHEECCGCEHGARPMLGSESHWLTLSPASCFRKVHSERYGAGC